jgi:energy-coupling factor transporter ATP-binding protein EcfA2
MRRVSVVGMTGSGKTTFAKALATALGIPYVELDALFWQAGWQESSVDDFRARVGSAVAEDAWVIDGNYWSRIGGLVWTRADTVVWLDPPFVPRFANLLWRTLRRSWSRVELWNGNRESFRGAFLSRDSLLLFALRTAPGGRRRGEARLAQPEYAHLRVHRLRSPAEADRWLQAERERATRGIEKA